jgi:hypothetical protein
MQQCFYWVPALVGLRFTKPELAQVLAQHQNQKAEVSDDDDAREKTPHGVFQACIDEFSHQTIVAREAN